MMKTKTVYAIIEASKTGFGIYAEDESLPLTSYGDTIDEAKEDVKSVLEEMLDYYKEKGETIPAAYNNGNIKFVFKYDIASIFGHFGVLDATQFAKK